MLRPFLLAGALACVVAPALAQSEEVVVRTDLVAGRVHRLEGRGGNLAVFAGEGGVFLVDDQFAPLTEKILAAVAEIHPGPVRFVLNTHWHGDHTGGNENLGRAGAVVVAHDNVRTRMASEHVSTIWNRTTPASPAAALPVVTFDSEVSFHLDGEEIEVFHVPNAHTDGDAIVHFRSSDVIHLGDVWFNGLFPYVDTDSGGSVDGMIAACERVLGICGPDTRLIAGHGPAGGPEDLRAYRDLLRTVRDRIAKGIAEGKSLEEVQASRPTAEYDDPWGKAWIDGAKFTEILYGDLSRAR